MIHVIRKICTSVCSVEFEDYAPVLELSLNTTHPCTQTQLIIKDSCTQLKYLPSHCNRVKFMTPCRWRLLNFGESGLTLIESGRGRSKESRVQKSNDGTFTEECVQSCGVGATGKLLTTFN